MRSTVTDHQRRKHPKRGRKVAWPSGRYDTASLDARPDTRLPTRARASRRLLVLLVLIVVAGALLFLAPELIPFHRGCHPWAVQLASGKGSALRPSARHDSVCKLFPSRHAFQALMAIATSASRPESVEYWSRWLPSRRLRSISTGCPRWSPAPVVRWSANCSACARSRRKKRVVIMDHKPIPP